MNKSFEFCFVYYYNYFFRRFFHTSKLQIFTQHSAILECNEVYNYVEIIIQMDALRIIHTQIQSHTSHYARYIRFGAVIGSNKKNEMYENIYTIPRINGILCALCDATFSSVN